METVKIKSPKSEDNPLGFVVINATDLTDEHELFDKPAEEPKPAAQATPATAPATPPAQPWAAK